MEPQDVPVYPVLAFHTGALDVFVLYKSTFIYLLTYLLTYLLGARLLLHAYRSYDM